MNKNLFKLPHDIIRLDKVLAISNLIELKSVILGFPNNYYVDIIFQNKPKSIRFYFVEVEDFCNVIKDSDTRDTMKYMAEILENDAQRIYKELVNAWDISCLEDNLRKI